MHAQKLFVQPKANSTIDSKRGRKSGATRVVANEAEKIQPSAAFDPEEILLKERKEPEASKARQRVKA